MTGHRERIILWILIILFYFLYPVVGNAKVYFQYVQWEGNRTFVDGKRCSIIRNCNLLFRLKIGNDGSLGKYNSEPVNYVSRTITQNQFSNVVPQLLSFDISVPVPNEISVVVNVLDRVLGTNEIDQSIVNLTKSIELLPSMRADPVSWTIFNISSLSNTLSFSIRVVCSENFYGNDCMKTCIPQNDDSSGHYTCSRGGQRVCLPNYLPPNCTVAVVHSCSSNATCSYRGTCIRKGTNYSCLCNADYYGLRCEQVVNACNAVECANGGSCESTGREWRCVCASGWTGRQCEIARVVVCDRTLRKSLCKNDANCTREYEYEVQEYGTPKCHCINGYIGPSCNELHACNRADTCSNRGLCVVKNEWFECQCDASYSGEHCEVARDLKETSTCNKECPTGTQCAQTLFDGNHTEAQCVKLTASMFNNPLKPKGVDSEVWLFLLVGFVVVVVFAVVVASVCFMKQRKSVASLEGRLSVRFSQNSSKVEVANPTGVQVEESTYETVQVEVSRASDDYNLRYATTYDVPQNYARLNNYDALNGSYGDVLTADESGTQGVESESSLYVFPNSRSLNSVSSRSNECGLAGPAFRTFVAAPHQELLALSNYARINSAQIPGEDETRHNVYSDCSSSSLGNE